MTQAQKQGPARREILFTLLLAVGAGFTAPQALSQTAEFVYGADLSFVPWQRANGAIWSGFGHDAEPVELFHDCGWNVVRLRLWHTPDPTTWQTWHNLDSTLSFAHEVVDDGMKWMLDFHYSDTWADPGKQYVPAAWEDLELETLADSLHNYTAAVIARCRNEGILPDYVQIGNEINTGVCWPVGKLYGTGDDTQAWYNYTTLLKAAKQGVVDGAAPLNPPVIVLHSSEGGSAGSSEWWLDHTLVQGGLEVDVIGFSYYPWWHGSMDDLRENLNFVVQHYNLPVMVVESAYPWTLFGDDSQSNTMGVGSAILEDYLPDPQGQRRFFIDLADLVREVPDGMGLGIMLWEPAWISVPNATSGGENLAVFDYNDDALPGILIPERVEVNEGGVSCSPVSFLLGVPYPSPTNGAAVVTVNLPSVSGAVLDLFNVTGQRIRFITLPEGQGRQQRINIDLEGESSGVYLLRLTVGNGYAETRRIVLVR